MSMEEDDVSDQEIVSYNFIMPFSKIFFNYNLNYKSFIYNLLHVLGSVRRSWTVPIFI